MAGAMRKVGEYLGLVEQADIADDVEGSEPAQAAQRAPRRVTAPVDNVAQLPPRQVQVAPVVEATPRIEKITPRTYNDARPIGETYRSGVPVIMNLSDISDDDAKRLVDFAAGLVFAVHGTLHRITAKVFLLSPENVQVSEEDKAAIAAGGFYNQS